MTDLGPLHLTVEDFLTDKSFSDDKEFLEYWAERTNKVLQRKALRLPIYYAFTDEEFPSASPHALFREDAHWRWYRCRVLPLEKFR